VHASDESSTSRLDVADADAARAEIERMCGELLANPLIESFEIIRLGDA
jgi:phosphoribosylformylglycinamidine (FGAM) synthase PurS component